MSFSQHVKEQALLAAARHCCVCHRYKGMGVEVHHIEPKAEGGDDSLENAIALCFDCHMHAGHYNPQHPKGSKYRPSELREARDRWHEIVRSRGLDSVRETNKLHTRYLICQDVEIASEILSRDFAGLPAEQPRLIESEVTQFLRKVLGASKARSNEVRGDRYKSEQEFFDAHPDARWIEEDENGLSYFDATRQPSRAELLENVAPVDSVSRTLLEAGFSPEEVAKPLAYWEVCGSRAFCEIYRLRPLWTVFLTAKNTSDRSISFRELEVERKGRNASDLVPLSSQGEVSSLSLPPVPIGPGATIVFPVATLLGPFQHVAPEAEYFEETGYPQDELQRQQTQFVSYSKDARANFRAWGPSFLPSTFRFSENGVTSEQEVHELDLTKTFVLSRAWEMGSCPHLFFRKMDGQVVYHGELFAKAPNTILTEEILVPEDAFAAVIVELEEETTRLEAVRVDGNLKAKDMVLETGDVFEFAVGELT